jgi:hypothetical protein
MNGTLQTDNVRPLATEFKHGGFDYRQNKRQGNVAIFAQCRGGAIISYEVIIIRIKPGGVAPSGSIFPTREAYPSTEEWGRFAWTCVDWARAEARFSGLLQEMAKTAGTCQKP